MKASECPDCGRLATPPENRCPHCRTAPVATEVPDVGTVLAWTGVDGDWVGLVELDGGARVLADLSSRPSVGDAVRVDGDVAPVRAREGDD